MTDEIYYFDKERCTAHFTLPDDGTSLANAELECDCVGFDELKGECPTIANAYAMG